MGGINKIKITFFLPSLEAGGTERNTVNIVNNLDRKKFSASLLLAEAKGDFLKEINQDVPIVDLDIRGDLRLFFGLIKYFRYNENIDIFVSAFPRINIICLAAKIFSGKKIKIVITEHLAFSPLPDVAKTSFRRFFAKWILPYFIGVLYPSADAIVCVSKGVADELAGIIGGSKKIKVIYNPVMQENIYLKAIEPLGEDKYFFESGKPVIIAAGRLVKQKDYPNLLKALKIVLQNRQVVLVILGEGPEEESLKKISSALNIQSSVSFLGFKPNPYKYLAASSLFILSSSAEGFGNVIIEAMACGVPVVATDCKSGPGEIIQNEVNGLLVAPQDEKALALAIIKVLDSPELAKKLSEAGKERAKYFSVEKSVREYEDAFEEVLR